MLALLAYRSSHHSLGAAMANLTIRKLDDAIRDELRLRAARNDYGEPATLIPENAPLPNMPQ